MSQHLKATSNQTKTFPNSKEHSSTLHCILQTQLGLGKKAKQGRALTVQHLEKHHMVGRCAVEREETKGVILLDLWNYSFRSLLFCGTIEQHK